MPDAASTALTPTLSSRNRLLNAGKELFARNGFENTSTVTIAREAGTSESQLMKHFGSKQGLLTSIFERGWESIADRVRVAAHNDAPPVRLFGVLEAVAIELENDPDLKDLMMLEARRIRKDNHEVLVSRGFQHFASTVGEILNDMRRQGQLRPDLNLDAVRAAVVGMMEGLIRDRVVAKRSEFRANYGFEDVKKVLEILVMAVSGDGVRSPKAVNK
jgi:AcrR family transcriptional regulator